MATVGARLDRSLHLPGPGQRRLAIIGQLIEVQRDERARGLLPLGHQGRDRGAFGLVVRVRTVHVVPRPLPAQVQAVQQPGEAPRGAETEPVTDRVQRRERPAGPGDAERAGLAPHQVEQRGLGGRGVGVRRGKRRACARARV